LLDFPNTQEFIYAASMGMVKKNLDANSHLRYKLKSAIKSATARQGAIGREPPGK